MPRAKIGDAEQTHDVGEGLQDNAVLVHDLGSTNGTYVNGRRVTTPTTVSKGDTVQIGKTILEVR